MAKHSRQEIEHLKHQLDDKMGEYRTIYSKLVEAGGEALSEDILDKVTGGLFPIVPTSAPASGSGGGSGSSGGTFPR